MILFSVQLFHQAHCSCSFLHRHVSLFPSLSKLVATLHPEQLFELQCFLERLPASFNAENQYDRCLFQNVNTFIITNQTPISRLA